MSDEIPDSQQSVTAVQRTLGDPEIAVEILRLRVAELEQAIRRLADQDATLSVCEGNVTVTMDATFPDAESLARMFHDEYERRAEALGYETRPDTRRFDPTSINGRLMVATCRAVVERISPQPTLTDVEREAIWTAAESYAENDDDPECERIARVMQGLWQRTK